MLLASTKYKFSPVCTCSEKYSVEEMDISAGRYLHSMFFVSGCKKCGRNEIFCKLCKDHIDCSGRGDVIDTHKMIRHVLTHNNNPTFKQTFDSHVSYYVNGDSRSNLSFHIGGVEISLHERVGPYIVMLEKISDNTRISHLLSEYVPHLDGSDNGQEGIYYLSAGGLDIKIYDYYYTDLDYLLNRAFTIEADYRCPLCENEYDCFPAGEVFVEHMKTHYL